MSRKKLSTPRSRITSALRQLWLRSRERARALKDAEYKCRDCGIKQSTAKDREVKLQVHHDPPIDWAGIVDWVFKILLNANQYPLCNSCHESKHEDIKSMKKHVKIYLKHHNYGEQDVILCEKCSLVAVDIHHIKLKSMGGTDDIDNLIALCRNCHEIAHDLEGKRL
jgi:predicted HNH restriction endonuclease